MTNYQRNNSRSAYRAARPTSVGHPATGGRPAANGNYRPASARPQDVAQYQNRSRYTQRAPKKKNFKPAIITVLVLVALGIGAFAFISTRPYTVNVNGKDVDLRGEHTLLSLVEEGHASPQPGNLLAVDGSLLETAKGRLFEAQVNGEEQKEYNHRIKDKDVIVISDGGDESEPATETETTIPFETQEETGWGPIHRFEGGVEGKVLVRTGEISGLTHEEEVVAPQNKYLHNYSADTQGEKVIALTFDDGPWGDTTAEILDILKENEASATFFVLGELIDQSPTNEALVKRAFNEGHQIATHTYSHARGAGNSVDLSLMSDDEQVAEVTKGFDAIKRATGEEPSHILRTPGGNFKDNTKRLLEPHITAEIGWNIDTEDWRQPGADSVAAQIKSAQPGNIVLMHDGGGNRGQTVDGLRQALPYLREQGYQFVTIDKLLEYPAAE